MSARWLMSGFLLLAGLVCAPAQSRASVFFSEAERFSKQGDNAKAFEAASEAVRLEPNNDLYLATLSHFERIEHRFTEGLKHAKRAIEINPKVGWYYASAAFNADGALNASDALFYAKMVVELGEAAVGKPNLDSCRNIVDAMSSVGSDPTKTWPTVRDRAKRFFSSRGYAVRWSKQGVVEDYGLFKTIGPNPLAVHVALPLLEDAVAWVPKSVSRLAGINFIFSGDPRGDASINAAGSAAFNSRVIAMNVDAFHSRRDMYQFATHEVMHILEGFVMNEQVDAEWTALNEDGFAYLGYEAFKTAAPRKGFATVYSQSKGQEDRADLLMWLLVYSDQLAAMVKTDEILARKVDFLKAMLRQVSPDFNAAFWAKAAHGDFKPKLQ